MNDATTEKPVYDNAWLVTFLREIKNANETNLGLPTEDTAEWEAVGPDGTEKNASEIRRTLYQALLARKGKDGGLWLTEQGVALLASADAQ